MPSLAARQIFYDDGCGYDQYGRYRCYNNSAWNTWIRWVVLVVVVIGFLLLFFLCSCLTARKRRKAGRTPYYGTGWAARPPAYGETQGTQPYYGNNNNAYAQPAPPYSNVQGGANQGYYGNQQSGVELQSPQPVYGGQNNYAPPPGPPPGKVY